MNETRIELEHRVGAPRARAWAAWTESEQLARWWWHWLPGTTIAADARAGGSYRFENPEAGFGVAGEYLELEPFERLVFTWRWIDDGVEASIADTVTVRFADDGGGTIVTVEHVTDAAGAADYELGWRDTLERIDAAFS